MSTIRIQSVDRTWTAASSDGRTFRIGRDESSDIPALDPTVSRRHAEVRPLGDGWEVVDLGSSLGTWVDGRRVDRATLSGSVTLGFGDQGRSFTLRVTVGTGTASNPPAAPAAYGPPGTAPVQKPPAPAPAPQSSYGAPPAFQPAYAPMGPGGPGGPVPDRDQTIVTGAGGLLGPGGPGLLVRRRSGGTDLRFPGGVPVRVGRDASLEVHADDQAVSRLHAVIEPRPDGWWWVDRSTSGTFVDGERRQAFKIEEPTEISLGHPTAGFDLEVVPVVAAGQAAAGLQKRRRRRTLLLVGAAVLALVATTGVVLGVVAVVRDDDPGPVAGPDPTGGTQPVGTEEERRAALDRAKRASVLLQAVDESGQVMWSGSGSVVSEDGLILTNAHVGDPDAPGQGSSQEDPSYLEVSLPSEDDDAPATAAYRATPIVSDGYLDIAVLQIDADLEGNPVDTADLELPQPLPLGDSDDLRTGDRIVALGYPAIGNVQAQGDRPLTVTEGVVSTFQADDAAGIERAAIDSDVRLGSGNSGGASINEAGEIIGLNTRVITAASDSAGSITQGSALIVPVNLAGDVLEIAEQGGDPDYVSPYLDSLPDDPGLPPEATVTSNGWVRAEDAGSCEGTSSEASPAQLSGVAPGDTLAAEFTAEGLPQGLPITVDFFLEDGTRLDSLSETWDGTADAICLSAPLLLEQEVPNVTAVFSLGQDGQVGAVNPVVIQAG
ncbi:FHA domain-containing protein [Nocardioides litoris]|uniref:FHA domain-containing protein n=1 Tax=Nocardioides litoris TaxID=1926648 RepID=UPI001476922C|nr:FHA domain-containing protein [Nocardioides litoris]